MLTVDWKKMEGLVPAVVQHSETHQVLMLGYMNEEALKETERTGRVVFFSRSKDRLWTKGETSGNYLEYISAKIDCDSDAVLVRALPKGPTCHTGAPSCFEGNEIAELGWLNRLEEIIESRKNSSSEKSYTAHLFQEGLDRMAQKVGEEAIEVVIASKNESKERLQSESADLLFHLMVLLKERGLSLADVVEELKLRHTTSTQ